MARIDIKSAGATLSDGVLQLENGVAMDTTLRNVADQNNTTSPLKLSTTAVQVVSPFRITTDDPSDMYLDCEDGATNNRFNITRNTASQQVNLNFASNPAGSTTTVGAIRTFTNGVALGEVVKFREDGQVTFTERVNIEADSLVTTQTSSVIAASTTNANLVIAPNGTGALIASIPDGTATGGNARGINAVDLQTSRSTTANVASGDFSTIIGGSSCTASGQYSIVGGLGSSSSNYAGVTFGNANTNNSYGGVVSGGQNNIGGNASYVTISGGRFNNTTGSTNGVISGGISNTVSSNYSTISGGQSNTASTNTHATVVGGNSNTSSGQYSVSGGFTNTASGESAVALGRNNIASSTRGVSIGDNNNNSTSRGIAIGHDNVVTQAGGQFYAVAIGVANSISSASGSRNYVFGESNSISSNGLRNTAIGFGSSISGSANYAMAINGGAATGNYSLGKGISGNALYYNGETRGGGTIGGNQASVQTTDLIAFNSQTITTGGTFQLYLDGTVASQLITIATTVGLGKRVWNLQVRWVTVVKQIIGTATGVSVDDTKVSTDLLAVRRDGLGVIAVSPHTSAGTQVIETIAGSLTAVNVAYTAGGSSNLVATFTGPTFAGGGSLIMDVVAALEITELGY